MWHNSQDIQQIQQVYLQVLLENLPPPVPLFLTPAQEVQAGIRAGEAEVVQAQVEARLALRPRDNPNILRVAQTTPAREVKSKVEEKEEVVILIRNSENDSFELLGEERFGQFIAGAFHMCFDKKAGRVKA